MMKGETVMTEKDGNGNDRFPKGVKTECRGFPNVLLPVTISFR